VAARFDVAEVTLKRWMAEFKKLNPELSRKPRERQVEGVGRPSAVDDRRHELAREVLTGDRTAEEVAAAEGVQPGTVKGWIRRYLAAHPEEPGSGRYRRIPPSQRAEVLRRVSDAHHSMKRVARDLDLPYHLVKKLIAGEDE
jgi:transposase-like protein